MLGRGDRGINFLCNHHSFSTYLRPLTTAHLPPAVPATPLCHSLECKTEANITTVNYLEFKRDLVYGKLHPRTLPNTTITKAPIHPVSLSHFLMLLLVFMEFNSIMIPVWPLQLIWADNYVKLYTAACSLAIKFGYCWTFGMSAAAQRPPTTWIISLKERGKCSAAS